MSNLKQLRTRLKRAWKVACIAGRNLPLTLTSFGILTCVELFTAGGIVQTTTEQVQLFGFTVALATLEIGLSYGCGILSILGSGSVAELRADPRPEHQLRAKTARTVSVLLLVVPVVFFTNALAIQIQRSARLEYLASERYEIHRATALGQCLELAPGEDCYVGPDEQAQAQRNLSAGDEVKTARIDGVWGMCLLASLFVYGTLGWANTALYKPRPETPWEAKERHAAERRERARQREADKRAEEARIARASNVQRLPFTFKRA